MSVPEKIPLSELSRGDLEALAERLLAENAALKQAVVELRAEIAKLKGVTGRPAIRPSGMEQKTEPKPADKAGSAKQRTTERLVIDEERVIKADVPAGSRFKGYEDPDKGFSGSGLETIAGLKVALGLERVDLVGGDGRDDVNEGIDDGSMLGQIEGRKLFDMADDGLGHVPGIQQGFIV